MKRLLWALGAVMALLFAALVPPATAATTGPARHRAIAIVTLGITFHPSSVRLTLGEPLLVTVDGNVSAIVAGPSPDGPVAGGALGPDAYLYFATRPGTEVLKAVVGPRCTPGVICPAWRSAEAKLIVTVSP